MFSTHSTQFEVQNLGLCCCINVLLLLNSFISIQIADGLVLEKTSCPLGVLLIVFESRPDALVQVRVCSVPSVSGFSFLCVGGIPYNVLGDHDEISA